jgi:curved DNA-binding protein CbpA
MYDRAFRILGIEPTTDGRLIRAAYVRLARIYHPDRFVGMGDEVRIEAERRMKAVSAAYEELRAARRSASATPESSRTNENDPWEVARRSREAIRARRARQERDRSRWLIWEDLERQARDRADEAARFAAVIAEDMDGAPNAPARPPRSEPSDPPRSILARRLEEARGADRTALEPVREASA